jgi:hypothetical protein
MTPRAQGVGGQTDHSLTSLEPCWFRREKKNKDKNKKAEHKETLLFRQLQAYGSLLAPQARSSAFGRNIHYAQVATAESAKKKARLEDENGRHLAAPPAS